jgi:hypothetical protein
MVREGVMADDGKIPTRYTFEFSKPDFWHADIRSIRRPERCTGIDVDHVDIIVQGDGWGSGTISVPLYLWRQMLLATFQPPVASTVTATEVRVVLVHEPVVQPSAVLARPPPVVVTAARDPVEEARKALDRPLERRK